MARELKEIIVRDFRRRFAGLESCIVIDYQGLNAEQTTDLRNALRDHGVRMTVVHNRLAKLALSERPDIPKEFYELFRGPTALLYGEGGAVAVSKGLAGWRKKNRGLTKIKGGLFEGKVLSEADVDWLAALPDEATLRARIAARLVAPLSVLPGAVRTLLGAFPGAARARRRDLESSGGGEAGGGGS